MLSTMPASCNLLVLVPNKQLAWISGVGRLYSCCLKESPPVCAVPTNPNLIAVSTPCLTGLVSWNKRNCNVPCTVGAIASPQQK